MNKQGNIRLTFHLGGRFRLDNVSPKVLKIGEVARRAGCTKGQSAKALIP